MFVCVYCVDYPAADLCKGVKCKHISMVRKVSIPLVFLPHLHSSFTPSPGANNSTSYLKEKLQSCLSSLITITPRLWAVMFGEGEAITD